MEDFEYSVEICDRDWECFFAECEECNLLPPSLAGLEDSGMSDIDDAGSVLAMRAQRVDLSPGFSDTDRLVDGPPHCEGSPVEHYLSKHGIGGMESVLSGSEEDIHLQSVNIFFERLKSLTEPEPSQNFGKNSEAIEKEERCSDGQQASRSTLPKNIQKLNSLPARGETAVGKESVRPVDTIRKTNTMRKVHSEPSISFQHEASNSVFNTNQSPETELFIREEACTETRVSKVPQWNHDSPGTAVCSVMMPHTYSVEKCTRLGDFKQEELLKHLCKKCATDLAGDLDTATNVKWRKDQTPIVSQSDAAGTNKAVSQDSPSASMKRKRRKKRRLSVEQGEGGHGYERQALVKQSESEEEQCATKTGTGLCFSEDISSFYLNEPQRNLTSLLTPHSTTSSSFPVNISTAPPCDSQYQCLSESIVRQRMSIATSENDAANNRSVITPSQTDDSVMSAPNSGATVATNAEVCSKLQEKESPGVNKCPELPVLMTGGVTGKSDMGRENQREDIKSEGLQQTNHSVILPENEKNLTFAAEVKSVTPSLLSGSDSNATSVDVGQNNRRSAAKSVLAVEAGNSGGDEHTPCHSEAEPQQQLEMEFHNTDQYSTTMEDTQHPFSAISHAKGLPANSLHLRTPACPFSNKFPNKVISTHCTSDCFNPSPDESYVSKSSFDFGVNNIAQQTERPLEVQTLPKLDILEKSTEAGRIQLAASQITSNGRAETKSPLSEDLPTSLSDITTVSSCCTLNTESIMSLSNGNITDMSASFCSSLSEQESGGQGGKRGDGTSGVNSQPESVCNLLAKPEDAIMVPKAECKPKGVLSPVFAMSSFWSEMEKLTINDILGLRMISKAAPPSSLPPLQESEEMADFGFFTQMEESTPEQTTEDSFSVPDAVESNLCPNTAADFSPSRSVLWESEPAPVSQSADIYLENVVLTSVTDASRPFLSERAEKCFRKISKNISVHNLRALESESFSYTQKCEPLQTVAEGESQKVEYFTQGYEPKQDKDTDTLSSSLTDSYSISLSDIFQYFFGGKQTVPSQSATDNLSTFSNDGNSVPETYDHFFSEFDTESFFCSLITTEDEAKDKPVLIFSCSRSANRNLQFPEAYDYFFASSSSDDSSVESDEEDNSSPVRVVTRSSHKPSSSHISKDVYEDFYTDSDLRQNFFWKTAFSFRGINFSASTAQKQESKSLSLVPVRQRGSFHPRTVSPLNALGNEDVMYPDPLLYHFEERVFRQLAQQPFRYEDLQTAVSNPRLDAPFLPLKQSDMCLVCIAFASWVMKTVNPQVGDAWKAVLLANVSALSAIRYLRKYVKVEAATSETKLHQRALPAPSSLSL